jgi:hypothetical protein
MAPFIGKGTNRLAPMDAWSLSVLSLGEYRALVDTAVALQDSIPVRAARPGGCASQTVRRATPLRRRRRGEERQLRPSKDPASYRPSGLAGDR